MAADVETCGRVKKRKAVASFHSELCVGICFSIRRSALTNRYIFIGIALKAKDKEAKTRIKNGIAQSRRQSIAMDNRSLYIYFYAVYSGNKDRPLAVAYGFGTWIGLGLPRTDIEHSFYCENTNYYIRKFEFSTSI